MQLKRSSAAFRLLPKSSWVPEAPPTSPQPWVPFFLLDHADVALIPNGLPRLLSSDRSKVFAHHGLSFALRLDTDLPKKGPLRCPGEPDP